MWVYSGELDSVLHAGVVLHHSFAVERQSQGELNLARRIGAGGSRQVRRSLIVGRKVFDSNRFIELHKVGRGAREAIIRDRHALVVAVQSIERFRYQLEFVTWS